MKNHLETKWGYIPPDGEKLVITSPDTPIAWDNYLYGLSGKFYAQISQRGMGPLYYLYENNLVSNGRNFVLGCNGRYWSLNNGDAPDTAEQSSCIQNPGFSEFLTKNQGVKGKLTLALALHENVELIRLELENESAEDRLLDLTAVHLAVLAGADNSQQLENTFFDPQTQSMLFDKQHCNCRKNCYSAFFGADRPADSWCGCYSDFLGGDVAMAQAKSWKSEHLPEVRSWATMPILALRYQISLAAGTKQTLHFVLGIGDDLTQVQGFAREKLNSAYVESQIDATRKFYQDLVRQNQIETPQKAFNSFLNVWNKVQLFHQIISGRKGECHNWRNNIQDSMGALHFNSEICRNRIIELCNLAFPDGHLPIISAKSSFVSEFCLPFFKKRSDDTATWVIWSVAAYIRETGDVQILEEPVASINGSPAGTVKEALLGGIQWTLDNRGQHGLVLFKDADWSDPLELAGQRGIGESTWCTAALIHGLKHFIPVMEHIGDHDTADRLRHERNALIEALNAHGWDGAWYIRGITDDQIRFCTATDPDANISLIMQMWTLLAGAVPPERRESVIASMDRCKSPLGPVLYQPPFLRERPELGRESAKKPGCAENGSCYTHGAMMLAYTELALNRPEEALKAIMQVIPLNGEDKTAVRQGTPLWWPNYYQSEFGQTPGRSSNIINSGAAGWLYLCVLNGFAGIHPDFDALEFDPKLPASWPYFRVERLWRGAHYKIEINQYHGTKKELYLDGKKIAGLRISAPETAHETHTVRLDW